ncbi:hypothetical protein VZT92_026007 [Zoarces viviparus]|uniref:Uncharacterized protein n=1 Tax=Zoarces viviparus TaxID=48416 RepID=A0AAW1E0Q4_ZOAVI
MAGARWPGALKRDRRRWTKERRRKKSQGRHFWMDKEDESATGASIGNYREPWSCWCASVCVSRLVKGTAGREISSNTT